MASTITSSAENLTGQLFEIAHAMSTLQETPETNPNGKKYIREMNVDVNKNMITFRVALSFDETFVDGGLQFKPDDELLDVVPQTASAVA